MRAIIGPRWLSSCWLEHATLPRRNGVWTARGANYGVRSSRSRDQLLRIALVRRDQGQRCVLAISTGGRGTVIRKSRKPAFAPMAQPTTPPTAVNHQKSGAVKNPLVKYRYKRKTAPARSA